jgi:hypothetical protein
MKFVRNLRQFAPVSSTHFFPQSRSLANHFGPTSATPLAEYARSTWPERPPPTDSDKFAIPKRTVPDSALKFTLRATFEHGVAIQYPHLQFHPADFKVKVTVIIILHFSAPFPLFEL